MVTLKHRSFSVFRKPRPPRVRNGTHSLNDDAVVGGDARRRFCQPTDTTTGHPASLYPPARVRCVLLTRTPSREHAFGVPSPPPPVKRKGETLRVSAHRGKITDHPLLLCLLERYRDPRLEEGRPTATEIAPELRASSTIMFRPAISPLNKKASPRTLPPATCQGRVITMRPRHHRDRSTSWHRRSSEVHQAEPPRGATDWTVPAPRWHPRQAPPSPAYLPPSSRRRACVSTPSVVAPRRFPPRECLFRLYVSRVRLLPCFFSILSFIRSYVPQVDRQFK